MSSRRKTGKKSGGGMLEVIDIPTEIMQHSQSVSKKIEEFFLTNYSFYDNFIRGEITKMMKRMSIVTIWFLLMLGLVSNGFSEEAVTNRQILEKLDRMDEKINNIDVRVARIEEGQKNSQKQIDDIRNLLYVILSGMFALVGFILWDRRTALAPAVKKMEVLEEREGRLEKILRAYAEKEPKLAQVMRNITL